MSDDAEKPLGSPTAEALKAAAATAVGAVPYLGTLVSAALWGAIQADTTANLNFHLRRLEKAIDASRQSADALLRDPIFRAGVALLCRAIANQEADSKLSRIQSFLAHRLAAPRSADVVAEAVLSALAALPSSHIESFLTLLGTEEQLRDFVAARGPDAIDIPGILTREFKDAGDQDHCGSPLDVRSMELTILCRSLENAGLVKSKADERKVFETTVLAKEFVWYCLPPEGARPEGAA